MKNLWIALASICLFSSCFTYTELTEAETFGKGNHHLEISAIGLYNRDYKSSGGGVGLNIVALPVGTLKYQYGLSNRTDLHLNVNSSGFIGLAFNYNFYKNENFAIAVKPLVELYVGRGEAYFYLPGASVLTSFATSDQGRILFNVSFNSAFNNDGNYFYDSINLGYAWGYSNRYKIGISSADLLGNFYDKKASFALTAGINIPIGRRY